MLGLSRKPFHIVIIEHYFEKVKRGISKLQFKTTPSAFKPHPCWKFTAMACLPQIGGLDSDCFVSLMVAEKHRFLNPPRNDN
jgi:hypothetical protein